MPTRQISEVIRQRPVPTAEVATTVRQAAKIMKEYHSSALVIVQKGVLAGICTERDIVFGVVATDRDPTYTRVDAVMTSNVQTIGPEKPLGHALHIMYEGGFRHVPVVDIVGHPIGLLVASDALDLDLLQFEKDLVRRQEITVLL